MQEIHFEQEGLESVRMEVRAQLFQQEIPYLFPRMYSTSGGMKQKNLQKLF